MLHWEPEGSESILSDTCKAWVWLWGRLEATIIAPKVIYCLRAIRQIEHKIGTVGPWSNLQQYYKFQQGMAGRLEKERYS